MPVLLASPGTLARYEALADYLALKRNAESRTRADADKMSALPAQPTDHPGKIATPEKCGIAKMTSPGAVCNKYFYFLLAKGCK